VKLDAIDLRILAILQRDGRITKLKLAEEVHLSPSACWARMTRLEEAGIISGYAARLDIGRVVRIETVLTEITLNRHRREDFETFERHVRGLPDIVECHATGGGVDYIAKFVVTDIDRYQRLMDALLGADLGIERYFTYVVTRTVKQPAPLPLDILLEQTDDGPRSGV
jgi:Lrp/AsnC family transcriptional regulator, regulator of ectoine-degradation genes